MSNEQMPILKIEARVIEASQLIRQSMKDLSLYMEDKAYLEKYYARSYETDHAAHQKKDLSILQDTNTLLDECVHRLMKAQIILFRYDHVQKEEQQ